MDDDIRDLEVLHGLENDDVRGDRPDPRWPLIHDDDLRDMEALHNMDNVNIPREVRRQRRIRQRVDFFAYYDDTDFRRRFRITKATAHHLVDLIRPTIEQRTDRNNCIPANLQLLTCLRFFATGMQYIFTAIQWLLIWEKLHFIG